MKNLIMTLTTLTLISISQGAFAQNSSIHCESDIGGKPYWVVSRAERKFGENKASKHFDSFEKTVNFILSQPDFAGATYNTNSSYCLDFGKHRGSLLYFDISLDGGCTAKIYEKDGKFQVIYDEDGGLIQFCGA